MKTILSIILFLGVCGICTAQEGFKIVGQLGGSLGGKLVLAVSGEQGFVKLGETEMVNGSFEFSGSVPGPGVAYIMDEKQQLIATIMIENREFLLTAGGEGIDVEGGEAQEVWNVFDAINKRVMRANMIKEQKFQVAYARPGQSGCRCCPAGVSKGGVKSDGRATGIFQELRGHLCGGIRGVFTNGTSEFRSTGRVV